MKSAMYNSIRCKYIKCTIHYSAIEDNLYSKIQYAIKFNTIDYTLQYNSKNIMQYNRIEWNTNKMQNVH